MMLKGSLSSQELIHLDIYTFFELLLLIHKSQFSTALLILCTTLKIIGVAPKIFSGTSKIIYTT